MQCQCEHSMDLHTNDGGVIRCQVPGCSCRVQVAAPPMDAADAAAFTAAHAKLVQDISTAAAQSVVIAVVQELVSVLTTVGVQLVPGGAGVKTLLAIVEKVAPSVLGAAS